MGNHKKLRKRITKELTEEAIRLHDMKFTRAEIAKALDLSVSTVSRVMVNNGRSKGRGGASRKYTEGYVEKLRAMKDSGMTYTEISEAEGIPYASVYSLVRKPRVDNVYDTPGGNTIVFQFNENDKRKCYDEAEDCFWFSRGKCKYCSNTIFKEMDGTRRICPFYENKTKHYLDEHNKKIASGMTLKEIAKQSGINESTLCMKVKRWKSEVNND